MLTEKEIFAVSVLNCKRLQEVGIMCRKDQTPHLRSERRALVCVEVWHGSLCATTIALAEGQCN